MLGGLLVTSLSWRWVFFVNLPLGILAITFGALFLERIGTTDAGRLDLRGWVLGGAGLGLLMYGVSEGPLDHWSSTSVVVSCTVGAALLGAFTIVELRTRRPLVDLRLLSERLFRSTNAIMFVAAAAFLGMLYLIPLYFQDARGLTPLQSGLSTFPEAFGVMIGAQLASRLIYPRVGPRRHITGGLLGLVASTLVLTQITVTTNLWFIRGLMFVLGLDDGAGHGPQPGSLLRHDHAGVHGPRLDVLQHDAPGGQRHRRRHPLDGADRRRVRHRVRRRR